MLQFCADRAHLADTAGRQGCSADTVARHASDDDDDDDDDNDSLPVERAVGRRRHGAVSVDSSVRHSAVGTRAEGRMCRGDDVERRGGSACSGGV